MWLTAPNRIGIAAWQTGDSVWRLEAHGGREGIRLFVEEACLAVVASGDEPLPVVVEQFVRGDELHLSYPEIPGETEFGLRLVIRPADADSMSVDGSVAGFELLVSVETSRLDSHPTVDLTFPASTGIETLSPIQGASDRVYLASSGESSAAVLLQQNDAPFTSVVSTPDSLRLRLFGEFLEKGVIRRARPWVLLRRAQPSAQCGSLTEDRLKKASHALAASPVRLD